jgi:hypothetical protein
MELISVYAAICMTDLSVSPAVDRSVLEGAIVATAQLEVSFEH